MLTVRPYEERDKKAVQDLCILNAGGPGKSLERIRYTLNMYCNYYIEQEPDNCFVAVDEDDSAAAYVISTEDYGRYSETYKAVYMPQARALGYKQGFMARFDMLSHWLYRKEYPAHLHIDVDPRYHRQGAGTLLLDKLFEHLRGKGVEGIMLVCGADNTQACNFYKKNGFTELRVAKEGAFFGIKL